MNAEEPAQQDSESPETAPSNAPADFAGYVKWRQTGDPPAVTDPEPQAPAAAAEEKPPQAKTEPQSGAEEPQQTDEEEEPEGEEQQSAAGRRSSSRQRKIDRLTRELAEVKALVATTAQPKTEPAKPEPPPGKPRLENYETLEDYQEALTDWNITLREAKRAEQDAQQKLQTEWDSRQQAARKAHPDYDDVLESTAAPEGPGVAAARLAMLEDDAGAEILYHLVTHPDELKRLAALQPIAAVREIGRLSAIVSPSSTAQNGTQRFTAAPKPPPPSNRPAKSVSDSLTDPAVLADFRRYAKLRAQTKDK